MSRILKVIGMVFAAIGIVALVFTGAAVGGFLNTSEQSVAIQSVPPAQKNWQTGPQPVVQAAQFSAIPEGDFKPSQRVAIIVREVDFRGSNPVAFFRVQFVEVGQSLVFGRDAVTKGANRDGWTFNDENIEQANKTAIQLAVADARGNIPNATVWLQLECPSEQLKTAQERKLEVQNFGGLPFVRVPSDVVDDAFAKVCGITPASGTQPPQQPAPAPQQPAPATGGNTVLAFEARENIDVFPTGWIVEEVVNNLTRKITVEAKNVSSARARIDGAIHFNYWTNYGSKEAAESGACTQFAERLSESQIQRSWNQGYQVALLSPQCPAGPKPAPTK